MKKVMMVMAMIITTPVFAVLNKPAAVMEAVSSSRSVMQNDPLVVQYDIDNVDVYCLYNNGLIVAEIWACPDATSQAQFARWRTLIAGESLEWSLAYSEPGTEIYTGTTKDGEHLTAIWQARANLYIIGTDKAVNKLINSITNKGE